MQLTGKQIFNFGPYRLNVPERQLWKENSRVQLTPKVFELLLALVQNPGRLLMKDELIRMIWPDSFVEEANLSVNMSSLRKALGESSEEALYIETVPRRGYRFIGEVKDVEDSGVDYDLSAAEPTTVTSEEQVTPALSIPAGRTWPRRVLFLAGAALLIQVSVIAWFGFTMQRKSGSSLPGVKTLAVLPFKSVKQEDNDEYLRIGMADVLITRLSNLDQLVVRPTSSVMGYSGQDSLSAGKALKVDAVLDGTIQQVNDRVRVTVRLVRVSDGQPLWSYQCDQQSTDVFALQDMISGKVTESLQLKLSGSERDRLMRRYTSNVQAYNEYARGRYLTLQFTPQSGKQAISQFKRALELDPNYALAYAGLADAIITQSEVTLPPAECMPPAMEAARKALALDDSLAEAHGALGHAYLHLWRFKESEAELQQALSLNPNSVTTNIWYAEMFALTGNPKGLELMDKVEKIDPLTPSLYGFRSFIAQYTGNMDLAIKNARKLLEIDPQASQMLIMALLAADVNRDECRALIEGQQPGNRVPEIRVYQAILYGRLGRKAEALKVIDDLEAEARQKYISPYILAEAYTGAGDFNKAFGKLEVAFKDQSEFMPALEFDPILKPLRSDSRFKELVQRVSKH